MNYLKRKGQNFMDSIELVFDMKDFFAAIFGFMIFQFCAYILAGYA